ncbi:efflux RND transporter periplasmic adaptor subunit [Psychromonas sp. MME2]|uniref:efflux RND transporter periplasmic adaptor subunit n=1 Tax=unclassified Psychromonas TaxID=2614957 RepID=UPI00339C8949
MLAKLFSYFTSRPYWIALLIVIGLVFWMFSKKEVDQSTINNVVSASEQQKIATVQTTHFIPQKMTKILTLYGRSEANTRAVIRAEVAGKVTVIATQKGRSVTYGTKLAELDKNELPERLEEAKALLNERLLNYNAVKSLNDKGLQGRVRLAEMKSLLLAAQTNVKYLQLQLLRTEVKAPFAGILQEQYAEKGDYVKVGDAIFSLENIDPIVIRGDATEHHINQLKLGEAITATLLSGEKITGKITYIASLANPQSSTFRIEAEFPNPNLQLFSGISAKLAIPLYPIDAIYISPSALAIDEEGNLGVKAVRDGVVQFKAIKLLEADNEGAWVSGVAEPIDIITLGQGFVKPGDPVHAVPAEK